MTKLGFLKFIYIAVLPVSMSVHHCVPSAGGRQKRASDPLELELYRQV